MQVAGQRLGGATRDSRIGERIGDFTKIHVQIFGPRRPVRAEQAKNIQFVLDAATNRKPGLAVGERWTDGGAARSLREALLDFSIGAAASGVEQGRSDRIAQPAAYGTEPRELLIDRCRTGAVADVRASQVTAAGTSLEIGVYADNPASELPIVSYDAPAVETARRQEECLRVGRRNDKRAVIAAYPVTEGATHQEARPIVGRSNGRRLIRTEMVIDAAAKYLLPILHIQGAHKRGHRGHHRSRRNCV